MHRSRWSTVSVVHLPSTMSAYLKEVREMDGSTLETEPLSKRDLTESATSSSKIPVIYSYQPKFPKLDQHVLGLLATDRQVGDHRSESLLKNPLVHELTSSTGRS